MEIRCKETLRPIVLMPALFAMAVIAMPQTTGVPRYTVSDCGPSLVRTLADTPGLNGHGDFAVWRPSKSDAQSGVLLHGKQSIDIHGKQEYSIVYPADVNDRLTVAGTLQAPQDSRFTQAFEWKGSGVTILPGIGGKYSEARALNNNSLIVGSAQTKNGSRHAVLWRAEQTVDLGLLERGDYSNARDINDSGDIVGEANSTPNGKSRAVLWHGSTIHPLLSPPGSTYCTAQAINSSGAIAGSCDIANGTEHGMLWEDSKVLDLGTLGDEDATSTALDINTRKQIVGSSAVADGRLRGFLWDEGKMYDLNDLLAPGSGWLILVASRINDSGVIAGRGYYHNSIHSFLLHPNRTAPQAK